MISFRQRFSAIVLVIGAGTLLLFSISFYRSAKAAAQIAVSGYLECQQLLEEIEGFRNAPRIASLEVEPPDRIAARVTTAAADSNLAPNSIVSVDPQTAIRMGRTDYQIRATQIALQNASLKQVADFVIGLEEPSSGMVVRDVSLNRSISQREDENELWNVRLTLTQMIFSPISGR